MKEGHLGDNSSEGISQKFRTMPYLKIPHGELSTLFS